jgi:hypothetical protein
MLSGALLVVEFGSARSQTNADITAVIAANDGYYAAVSTLDPAAMELVWAHEAYVDNVGPQHKAIQFGWEAPFRMHSKMERSPTQRS